MENKKLTIDDLLNSLKSPDKPKPDGKLPNTKETWERIGNKDSFTELGIKASELESFLSGWVKANPYMNI